MEKLNIVCTYKKLLRAAKSDPGNLQFKLAQFILPCKNTPHSTTGLSPAELFLKRPLKTRLDFCRKKGFAKSGKPKDVS